MSGFRRLLVATDFSPSAEAALEAATEPLAATLGLGPRHGRFTALGLPLLLLALGHAGEHAGFDVFSKLCHAFRRQSMINGGNILGNDRSFIQVSGDIVSGRAHQFHAAIVGLMIGPRAFKARQG